jgi:hypothetical protein
MRPRRTGYVLAAALCVLHCSNGMGYDAAEAESASLPADGKHLPRSTPFAKTGGSRAPDQRRRRTTHTRWQRTLHHSALARDASSTAAGPMQQATACKHALTGSTCAPRAHRTSRRIGSRSEQWRASTSPVQGIVLPRLLRSMSPPLLPRASLLRPLATPSALPPNSMPGDHGKAGVAMQEAPICATGTPNTVLGPPNTASPG